MRVWRRRWRFQAITHYHAAKESMKGDNTR